MVLGYELSGNRVHPKHILNGCKWVPTGIPAKVRTACNIKQQLYDVFHPRQRRERIQAFLNCDPRGYSYSPLTKPVFSNRLATFPFVEPEPRVTSRSSTNLRR